MDSNQRRKIHEPSSGRGGYREGAGRKPGSTNQMSKEAREQARLSGRLPHEILLSIARGEPQEVIKISKEGEMTAVKEEVSLDRMTDAAKAAAPYYAPKISTVELISGVGDDDLNQLIAQLASEAGIGLGAGGAGTEGEDPPRPTHRVKLKS
jgi:hypothetical protein